MSDTVQPDRFRAWRYTPMRDLLRGRVTGELDVQRRIAVAALPQDVRDLVSRVVRSTRLWRAEKIAVADELIAHFADGIAAGATSAQLVRDFGAERDAAKLIRRATRRNRSALWHAFRFARTAVAVLFVLYVLILIRFLCGEPTIRIDYVAELNEPINRVPEGDRAWPIYRQAILALGMGKTRDPALDIKIDDDNTRTLSDARPSDVAVWPQLTAWLDAHRQGLDLTRAAAAKPALGFVYGEEGSAYDPELGFPERPDLKGRTKSTLDGSIVSTLLPHLRSLRQMERLLSADMRYARSTGNSARAEADIVAMIGMARHMDFKFVICQLVSISAYQDCFTNIADALVEQPGLFDDATLIRIAHRVGTVGGNSAASFLDFTGERFAQRDIVQRLYTDDGNGDGRFTREAIQTLQTLTDVTTRTDQTLTHRAAIALIGSGLSAANTRRAVTDEFDHLMSQQEARLTHPAYELRSMSASDSSTDQQVRAMESSPFMYAELFPVHLLAPSLDRATVIAERLIARRDALVVGIALELYRRQHDGHYPATLDEMVPTLLPHVPADRVTGDPIRYRLIDGKPVIYSVGNDGVDDGGRMPIGKDGLPNEDIAALGGEPIDLTAAYMGQPTKPLDNSEKARGADWVLYGDVLVRAQAQHRNASKPRPSTAPTTQTADAR